jgi:signal transduction histidine kinase
MRERLELLGGELQVESKLGGGTTLYISVPKRSTVQAGKLWVERHMMVALETGT